MKKNKMKYFKKKLLKRKESAINTLEMMENHHPTDESIKEYTNELSSYDNHPADQGSELFIMMMGTNLENHQHYKITEIDKALQNIKNGTYGKCETCGNNIEEERLELIPETNICIKCAENKLEAYKLDTDRPVEEDVLSPSYRTNYKNYNNYTGFDGEDAYQSVAKYNDIKNDPSFATGDHLGIFDHYNIGTVEEIENISKDYYKSQLPYTGDGIMDVEDQIDK